MKRALIIIDYTNDFVKNDGALTCGPPAQALEKYIHDVTETFMNENDLVVFGVDVHEEGDPYHPETDLFPPHNIRGTKGRELYGSLQKLYKENKHEPNTLYMDKTRYSAFAGTDLDLKLRERGITDLHLVGVCTDICVLHSAIDAYNLGYHIHVHKDGVASFNEAGHTWALSHFESTLGAKIL
ncbi:cysteine hydrolase [Halobacillus trueperi]|uniref:Nicotinamidase-related amidase n=2 Tax=Halobacillus TaxID=45667 RepID=A0A1H0TX79_HALAD|nr:MULTISPECIES: isochorismatase family cysteine hydrolase [Halobacillus]RDY69926.1 cysteine hydrolase [Halobacillus trueperi]SDP58523.1 Nicotinamidase-related amidase [Halobacillus aidingensis]